MLENLKKLIKPLLGQPGFEGSAAYWENRYRSGGNSGSGSYGELARFKADYLNGFVKEHAVRSVLEFGCGDGNQLTLAIYPYYTGIDVSLTAVRACRERFASDATKCFMPLSEYASQQADLVLSLDVIYHLVEDAVFDDYMKTLFAAAERFVIIYSCDAAEDSATTSKHVRPRKFTRWVEVNAPGWALVDHVPNRLPFTGDSNTGSWSDFYVYAPAARRR